MKKMLILGAAMLGLCTMGHTARAGDDGPYYNDDRPAPRVYEGRVAEPRCYLPPPPPVYLAPYPRLIVYPRSYYRHRHFYPYPNAYSHGYAPGIHIGIGF